MEFVDGVNLRQLLTASRIAPREALAIVPQICDALQYAHDQGIALSTVYFRMTRLAQTIQQHPWFAEITSPFRPLRRAA